MVEWFSYVLRLSSYILVFGLMSDVLHQLTFGNNQLLLPNLSTF